MSISVSFKGDKRLIRNLKRMGDRAPKVLGDGLQIEAEKIMTESKTKFVPVDTGNLRSTGFVNNAKIVSGGVVEVSMGYGGTSAPYALFVHEGPANLNWNISGTGPKYLEKPAKNHENTKLIPNLSQYVKRNLR